MNSVYKYPKTYHLVGSGLPQSKKAKAKVPFEAIASRHLVVEEKMDGANVAISFDSTGKLLLQNRGHFLTGGGREKHFSLFKQWAYGRSRELYSVLGDRYILYGEWLYAKHTIFYNHLPHYFLEYDVLDLQSEAFLATPVRQQLLQKLAIVSVPILYTGKPTSYPEIISLVGQSNYIKDNHLETLKSWCQLKNLPVTINLETTDNSSLMEGLYIKIEEDGIVKERYKYVREEFIATILGGQQHWLDRPLIPNQLQNNAIFQQSY